MHATRLSDTQPSVFCKPAWPAVSNVAAAAVAAVFLPIVWREDDEYASYSKAATKNWAAEETDTRFETESDMMELCDLAEIM